MRMCMYLVLPVRVEKLLHEVVREVHRLVFHVACVVCRAAIAMAIAVAMAKAQRLRASQCGCLIEHGGAKDNGSAIYLHVRT